MTVFFFMTISIDYILINVSFGTFIEGKTDFFFKKNENIFQTLHYELISTNVRYQVFFGKRSLIYGEGCF